MLYSQPIDLKNQRVRVDSHAFPEPVTGVLRGVTESRLFVDETPIDRSEVYSVVPAPLYCLSCKASADVLHDELCASCYRKEAQSRPTPREPCEVCGAPGVRDPSDHASPKGRFLCTTHHAAVGNSLRLSSGTAVVLAECATEDVSSPKHEWRQVRGARFRCVRCSTAEKYDPELLRELDRSRFK